MPKVSKQRSQALNAGSLKLTEGTPFQNPLHPHLGAPGLAEDPADSWAVPSQGHYPGCDQALGCHPTPFRASLCFLQTWPQRSSHSPAFPLWGPHLGWSPLQFLWAPRSLGAGTVMPSPTVSPSVWSAGVPSPTSHHPPPSLWPELHPPGLFLLPCLCTNPLLGVPYPALL